MFFSEICINSCMADAKVATIPNEFSQDFERVIEMLDDMGINNVELASMWGKSVLDLSKEEEDRVDSILKEHGFVVSAIQTQIMKCHPRNSPHAKPDSKNMHSDLDYNLSRIDRAIELAERFKTNNIVTYSYFDKAGITESNWELMLKDYKFLVDKCKTAGKTMVLENEHDTYVALIDDIARIMGHFDSPHLRWLFDTGNLFRRVKDYTVRDHEKVGQYIGYWHIKDVKKRFFGRIKSWAVFGEGFVPFEKIFPKFIRDGYNGYFSAEPHQHGPKKVQLAKQHVLNLKEYLESL